MSFQAEKQRVRKFTEELDHAPFNELQQVFSKHCSSEHRACLSFPWREITKTAEYIDEFWVPFKTAFTALQRREDIFFAGRNQVGSTNWCVSMGHFMGLFDQSWLNIPATRKLTLIRYAEFHEVMEDKVTRSGIFIDLIGVMRQAGFDPLPGETGYHFAYPGPQTHDGVLLNEQDPAESARTAELVARMVADLDALNHSGDDRCSPDLLAQTWHDDMVWYGPAGIGASYTIPRYQEQHQYPFREGLKNKVFNGHVACITEGHYAGFFGWPNLKNTAAGFLNMPDNEIHAEMQVVDIYRRQGNKLAENWVIIDLPYWLHQQGVDVFDGIRGRT